MAKIRKRVKIKKEKVETTKKGKRLEIEDELSETHTQIIQPKEPIIPVLEQTEEIQQISNLEQELGGIQTKGQGDQDSESALYQQTKSTQDTESSYQPQKSGQAGGYPETVQPSSIKQFAPSVSPSLKQNFSTNQNSLSHSQFRNTELGDSNSIYPEEDTKKYQGNIQQKRKKVW